MLKKVVFLAMCSSFIVGCSSSYHMRINSTPSAAKVYCGGEYMGDTPDVHIYTDKINPDVQTEYKTDCILKWASGATKDVGTIKVNKRGGTRIQVDRPADAPNVELDYQVEYQQESLRNQKRLLQQNQQMLYKMNQPVNSYTDCYSDGFGGVHCSSKTY